MIECKEKDPQLQRKKNWVQRKRSTTAKEKELGAKKKIHNFKGRRFGCIRKRAESQYAASRQ
jgi:hypothetical protein